MLDVATPEIAGRYEATPLGLVLRKGRQMDVSLSIGEWSEIGRQLGAAGNGLLWCIGDWFVMGERSYGSTYTEAIAITGYAYQTLADCAYVASRVSRRDENLSFAHHRAVAPLAPAEQREWLERAKAEGWTREQLRRAIAGTLEPEAPERVQIERELKLVATTERAERWQAAAERAEMDFSDWAANVLDEAAA